MLSGSIGTHSHVGSFSKERHKARIKRIKGKKNKRLARAQAAENYDKAKLRASGLWDEGAAAKVRGSLVVTRIAKP